MNVNDMLKKQDYVLSDFISERSVKARYWKDNIARYAITLGGIVIVSMVCLILCYLFLEVYPLFKPAQVKKELSVSFSDYTSDKILHSGFSESAALGYIIDAQGKVIYYDTKHGRMHAEFQLKEVKKGLRLLTVVDASRHLIAYMNTENVIYFAEVGFIDSFENNQHQLLPNVRYQENVVVLPPGEHHPTSFVVKENNTQLTVVFLDSQNNLYKKQYIKEQSMFSDEILLKEEPVVSLSVPAFSVQKLLIDQDQRWLYALEQQGHIEVYDLQRIGQEKFDIISLSSDGNEERPSVTSADLLHGDFSLLVGDSTGQISQWFPVRKEDGSLDFTRIRSFKLGSSPIISIWHEQKRKGFVALSARGQMGIFNATAESKVWQGKVKDVSDLSFVSLSPRADYLSVLTEKKLQLFSVNNRHAEVSWSSLWKKVWYEGYSKPEYVWQSSSASNDFEPKFSLVPLAFGTIKAAFYAMLFAVPLAICGAVYTAFFMHAGLRNQVKPAIELMAALPTVILGFIAGLWLAPFLEQYLLAVLILFTTTPAVILLVGLGWNRLPLRVKSKIPDGSIPLILIPFLLLFIYFVISYGPSIEGALFGGDFKAWLSSMGIRYDQRNALVVGIIMGFAVIPTIFSIAEDALFSVPKTLMYGSFALGATPWQTLVRVILPTSSPGIFSGVMIGFGRAIGETMIVLMATGNTPVMEFSIFEGLRTLSANIATEMPETEVASTHFRILFLAAFVLFIFTFILNTTAELVRQKLREKYGNL